MPDSAPCRSCRRPVFWAKTAATGKPMPLDEDDERGNVILDCAGRAHVFRDRAAALAAAEADEERFGIVSTTYISHHAEGQCPKGPAWRGKKRTDPDAPAPVQEALPL